VYNNPPITLLVYTTKKNIKEKAILDTRTSIMSDIKDTQEEVGRAYKILWSKLDNLLEQFRMDTLVDLEEETLTKLMIEDVETRRSLIMKSIELVEEIDKEVLEKKYYKSILIDLIGQGLHITSKAHPKDK
jgi:hypothetical protein